MAIHYENYARFSKGQGFIGSACRPISAQARSKRWKAVDCPDCKATACGRTVINSDMDAIGKIVKVTAQYAEIDVVNSPDEAPIAFSWQEIDENWAPIDFDDIFRDEK